MGNRFRTLAVFLTVMVLPAPGWAWGFGAHKYIMRRAIDLLPPELKPFYQAHRDEVVMRVVDPDLWRSVGWDENANHFLDFGVSEYGAYPFTSLPRDHGAALEKYGLATLKRNGTLPWRAAEFFGNLRRAFEGFARNNVYAVGDTILFSAVTAHYIQDAHQPLHATDNFDGQLSGQQGVHSRFEVDLFDRYTARLKIDPAPPRPLTSARDAAFDILLESHQLVKTLLAADKEAAAGREQYDDGYFEAFLAKAGPLLERRIAESITATASLIIGAWEQAGKPAIRIEMPRPVQRIRK